MAWSCHYATGCFVAFLGDISTLKSGWNMKKIFCCPALELFHCLPLWKTVLIVSSRAFSLSTPIFSLSTPVDNSEATWKKATKCNKWIMVLLEMSKKSSAFLIGNYVAYNSWSHRLCRAEFQLTWTLMPYYFTNFSVQNSNRHRFWRHILFRPESFSKSIPIGNADAFTLF